MRARDAAFVVAAVVLMAPAILLTTLRLTEPPWGRAVQAVAFTPFALPLYAAALLLLVVVMLVRRTAAAPYTVTAVLATVGLVLHAWWFAPLVAGEVPEGAPGAEPVVVLTSNVLRGRADMVQLMEQVREHEVDLLVVTEVTESALVELDAAGLPEALPFREGTPGADGAVVGTMVFSDEPIRVVEVLDTLFGGLVVDTGGVRAVAVHPTTPVSPDQWRTDHAVVLESVEEHRPDLVAGDFNATPDHEPMQALADAGYRSSFELTNAGLQPTWPVDGMFPLPFLGPVAPIDHVLVSDEWTVTTTERTELDGSDHRPVVATVVQR